MSCRAKSDFAAKGVLWKVLISGRFQHFRIDAYIITERQQMRKYGMTKYI